MARYLPAVAFIPLILLWVGIDFWDGLRDQRDSGALLTEAKQDDARFRSVMADLPEWVVNTGSSGPVATPICRPTRAST